MLKTPVDIKIFILFHALGSPYKKPQRSTTRKTAQKFAT